MKVKLLAAVAAAIALAGAAHAGDAAAGEKVVKKCKACHSIVDADGNAILKGGKVGPNLFGVIGRQAGSYEGYKYSSAMIAAGEGGLVWTEEELAKFVADPSGYLKEVTGDSAAKSKMTFKLKKGGEDVAAYLAQFGTAQ